MRRVMLLALLALVLPTAALASSIVFKPHTFSAGPEGGILAIGPESVGAMVSGGTYTIHFFADAVGSELIGGTVTVTITSTGATAFQDSIATGMWSFFPFSGLFVAFGSLEPNATTKDGSFSFQVAVIPLEGMMQPSGALVSVTSSLPLPEPSALEGLLLGAGMLGLAEMARRKLKLELGT